MNRLEIGRVDLQSLEPIDEYNRPFRFKKPETLEYLDIKDKISTEDFNTRAANCLQTFKFSIGTLQSSSISRIIRKVEDLSEFSLHNLIKEKLFFHNEIMNKMYAKLGVNVKKNIIKDKVVTRDHWIPFVIYMMIFGYLYSQIRKLEYLSNFPAHQGFIYRLISFTSFRVLNDTMKKRHRLYMLTVGRFMDNYRVHNVWTRLGMSETISPYIPFIQRKKFKRLFSNYEINELSDRAYFNQMNRNKIIFDYIKSAIKVSQLKEDKVIKNSFFLHDRFVKNGKSNLYLFEEIIEDLEELIMDKQVRNREDIKINNFLKNLVNFGEPSDFLEKSLSQNMKYRFYDPMYINEVPIVNYFGEKIGLMFKFISYYGVKKYYIIFITLIFFVVLEFTPIKDMTLYKYFQFAQMIIINLYSLNFYVKWNQQENLFAMKFGQYSQKLGREPRVNFVGNYQRNLATNQMNQLSIPLKKVFWKRFLIYMINIFLLIVSVGVSIGVLALKLQITKFYVSLVNDQNVTGEDGGNIFKFFLVLFNAVVVELINILYDMFYVRMTNYENYSDLDEYETSLLIKRFAFKVINMFNSMIIIALFKSGFPLAFGECSNFGIIKKGSTNCFTELRVQGEFL